MEDLKLADAYARFGAKVARGQRALSAIATDGAMVLSCNSRNFARTRRDVLRYEDTLSTGADSARHKTLLGEHLVLARDGELPVRLVIVTTPKGPAPRTVRMRADLVGKVTEFDGDRFVVDFSRILPPPPPKTAGRRKQ